MRRLGIALLGTMLMAQSPAPRPVATTWEVMEAMSIPASNALFEAGVEEPKSDEDWAKLRRQALILAESGNLLMIGSRVVDQDRWMAAALLMVEAGAAAKRAVEEKDIDKLAGEVGEQILNSCQGCHDQYLKR